MKPMNKVKAAVLSVLIGLIVGIPMVLWINVGLGIVSGFLFGIVSNWHFMFPNETKDIIK